MSGATTPGSSLTPSRRTATPLFRPQRLTVGLETSSFVTRGDAPRRLTTLPTRAGAAGKPNTTPGERSVLRLDNGGFLSPVHRTGRPSPATNRITRPAARHASFRKAEQRDRGFPLANASLEAPRAFWRVPHYALASQKTRRPRSGTCASQQAGQGAPCRTTTLANRSNAAALRRWQTYHLQFCKPSASFPTHIFLFGRAAPFQFAEFQCSRRGPHHLW